MKLVDTISVNPSKTALGHVENPTSPILRSHILDMDHNSHSLNLLSYFFPTCKEGVSEYKKYEVPLRTLLSTILIVTGITCLETSTPSVAFAICSLAFGFFLAIGLFTRPVMIAAAIYYCIMGALAIRTGHTDISLFSLMFGCLVFGVIGSGKYSCDSIIHRAIGRHGKGKTKKHKENLMSYKVFHNVKY